MKLFFSFLLIIVIPTLCHAADKEFSTGSTLLQMAWALFIILGLILVLYAFAKKKLGLQSLHSGNIKIIEMRHLMPKTAIALIQVRGKEILIGIGPSRIDLITEFNDSIMKQKDFDTILAEEQ